MRSFAKASMLKNASLYRRPSNEPPDNTGPSEQVINACGYSGCCFDRRDSCVSSMECVLCFAGRLFPRWNDSDKGMICTGHIT